MVNDGSVSELQPPSTRTLKEQRKMVFMFKQAYVDKKHVERDRRQKKE